VSDQAASAGLHSIKGGLETGAPGRTEPRTRTCRTRRLDLYRLAQTPVYSKSKFLPGNHIGREPQLEFESALAATCLFERDAPEPKWSEVKVALRGGLDAKA
jgi:hypothetical protein